MVLIWRGSLLGLIVLGAVAAWTLFRPSRQVAVVGSLRLWAEALDALDRSRRRSTRRISASWVLLLGGGMAAVGALARPVWHSEGLARRVSVAICPSAELGDAGHDALIASAGALLDRLGPGDRVELLRPIIRGGASGYVSVAEARAALGEVRRLRLAAGDVLLPNAAADSQHVYRFAPAGGDVSFGPRVTVIELPADLPPVTVDAVGAVELAMGRAQVFISLRHHGATPWRGTVRVRGLNGAETSAPGLEAAGVSLAGGAREDVILNVPGAEGLAVSVEDAAGRAVTAAYLARVPGRRRTVALVGPDEPLLRRYVSADEALLLVASPASADVVIANRDRPPAGRAALVINPSADPPGWRRGQVLSAVVLDRAHVAADDAILRGVNLRSVAVRRLRPWVGSDTASQQVLVALGDEAVVLRDAPGPGGRQARRVYIAFELSADNTNLGMSEAFAVLLANAVRWLAPGRGARATYEYLPARDVAGGDAWQRLAGTSPAGKDVGDARWPGIFRDEAGTLRAVSLVGLTAGRPAQMPMAAVAGAAMPEPVPVGRCVELWALLSVLAAGLWLSGWAARLR